MSKRSSCTSQFEPSTTRLMNPSMESTSVSKSSASSSTTQDPVRNNQANLFVFFALFIVARRSHDPAMLRSSLLFQCIASCTPWHIYFELDSKFNDPTQDLCRCKQFCDLELSLEQGRYSSILALTLPNFTSSSDFHPQSSRAYYPLQMAQSVRRTGKQRTSRS